MAGKIKITFLGGVNTIGGNKFLLEDNDTRIFLDFGVNFNFGSDYFVDWLKPRTRFGLRDYFALDLIKYIPGLYSKNALEPCDKIHEWVEPDFDGIFISHVHGDHTLHLSYADEEIPIYIGRTTLKMLKSWETTTTLNFGAHQYNEFHTGMKIKINDWTIEPIHVDHSVPAAYGFLIHTPEKEIAYTGDYRIHGTMSNLSRDFLEKLKETNIDILLTEGTRVAPMEKRENLSEKQVHDRALDAIKKTKGIVIVSFYGRDVDRIKTIYKLANETGRKFVVLNKTAHLLESLDKDPNIEVPSPKSDLLIYNRNLKRYLKWEKEFFNYDNLVDEEYVRNNQEKLIMALDFVYFQEIIDIKPINGSLFLHSMSEAWDERDLSDEIKKNWCNKFNLKYLQAHSSGHCTKEEIFENINNINPKLIIPIHTEHSELFKEKFENVYLPDKKKEAKEF
ncbi:MAG: MBL fold metallo-hydrolase [Candidatus Helarchaeota archaeon]